MMKLEKSGNLLILTRSLLLKRNVPPERKNDRQDEIRMSKNGGAVISTSLPA
jgi:hypothetical protein